MDLTDQIYINLRKAFFWMFFQLKEKYDRLSLILSEKVSKELLLLLLTVIFLPMFYRGLAEPYGFSNVYWYLLDVFIWTSPENFFIQADRVFMRFLSIFPFYMFLLILLLNNSWFRRKIYEDYNKGRRIIHYLVLIVILFLYIYFTINGPLRRSILVEDLYRYYPSVGIMIFIIIMFILSFISPFHMIGIGTLMFITSLLENLKYWYPFPIMASAINQLYTSFNGVFTVSFFIVGSFIEVFGPGYALLSKSKDEKFLGLGKRMTLLLSSILTTIIFIVILYLNLKTSSSTIIGCFLRRLQFFVYDPSHANDLQISHVLLTRWRFFLVIGALSGFLIKFIDNSHKLGIFLSRWILYSSWLLYIFYKPFLTGGFSYSLSSVTFNWIDHLILLFLCIWMLISFSSEFSSIDKKTPFINKHTFIPWTFIFVSSLVQFEWIDIYLRSYPIVMFTYEPTPILAEFLWQLNSLFSLCSVLILGSFFVYKSFREVFTR